ncbi:hypothetical protein HHX38_08340 [Streptomyces sp. PKU-MA01144]|uniref:hypothetical protein n=1 Tax=Streptomyces sp. PKU-MA01144 TaxID=2729138 RepID=UPI0014816826|nr:hypothetical protein [Streptomyces sp. PKU-MA01144]NNJ04142.1 hypothetical protein [Streptomyces sp. PKU-MA01144]
MPLLAGQILTAGQAERLKNAHYMGVASGALTSTTTTYADIPGATLTLTTKAANATYIAEATLDANVVGTSPTILMVGRLMVDGVADTGLAVKGMVVADRATISARWQGTLAVAGSHTLKLQGALTAALAGGGVWQQTDTKLQVTISEVV